MAEKLLIYIHIPKAGGTTLQSGLRWHYKGRVQTVTSLERPLEEVAAEIKPGMSVVAGHLHYGLQRFLDRDCRYMTILREPVERVISLARYVLRTFPQQASLIEYIASGVNPQIDNGQTRLLAGVQAAGDVTSAHLEEAKRHLSEFHVVGLMERFDISFSLIRRSLGWKIPLYVTRNVSRETTSPTTEEIQLVEEHNRYDSELYDYGSQLFADQCSRYRTLELEAWGLGLMNKITTRVAR